MSHILVTGASGLVGAAIASSLHEAGHHVTGTYGRHAARVPDGVQPIPFDAEDAEATMSLVVDLQPECMIHTAAMPDIATCEQHPDAADRVNHRCPVALAGACAANDVRFIAFSTDQVFDGRADSYDEASETSPVHVYGRTKVDAERGVMHAHPDALIIRTSLVIGASPSGERSASEALQRRLAVGTRIGLFDDEIRCPVLVDDIAVAIAALLDQPVDGILHVAGPDAVSRWQMGVALADALGLDRGLIDRTRSADAAIVPSRPRRLVLETDRLRALVSQPPRGLEQAVAAIASESK